MISSAYMASPAGFEAEHTSEHVTLCGVFGDPHEHEGTRNGPIGQRLASGDARGGGSFDPVEQALAEALARASAAGEWSTVATLARELEARRRARESQETAGVIDLAARRGGAS